MSIASETLSRRSLLRSSVASAVILAFPIPAFADPITVTGAIGVVMSVFGAINSAKTVKELEAHLAEISTKLDVIILNQERLFAEIKALKLYFTEELFQRSRDDKAFDLKSLKFSYDDLFAGTRPIPQSDLKNLLTPVKTSTYTLGQYDFGAFLVFITGASMTLTLTRKSQADLATLMAVKGHLKGLLDAWLDPANGQGVTAAVAQAQKDQESAWVAIDAYPKSLTIGSRRDNFDTGYCDYHTVLTIAGNFNDGFSGQASEVKGDCRTFTTGHHGIGPFTKTLSLSRGQSPLPAAPDYGGIPSTPTPASQYSNVNEINGMRDKCISAMRHVRDLQFVQSQIRAASASLA